MSYRERLPHDRHEHIEVDIETERKLMKRFEDVGHLECIGFRTIYHATAISPTNFPFGVIFL